MENFFIRIFSQLPKLAELPWPQYNQGRSDAYVVGFHDGRHSGMKEAGNSWEHYIRDHERFAADRDYQAGWIAGEIEGKDLQAQAIGEASSGAYTGYRIDQEADKAQPHPKKKASENDVSPTLNILPC